VLGFTEYQFEFNVGCRNGVEAMETDGIESAVVLETMCIVSVGVHGDCSKSENKPRRRILGSSAGDFQVGCQFSNRVRRSAFKRCKSSPSAHSQQLREKLYLQSLPGGRRST
jgi:hypothetical protein